ncbi:hypothetical protein VKS41_004037 [Umbelopsis sp. WA50703]
MSEDKTSTVTKDVGIAQISYQSPITQKADPAKETREASVIQESNEKERPYIFNDDYNNELSVELMVNTVNYEAHANHDTKSDEAVTHMMEFKKQQNVEQHSQHSLNEESIELDESPGIALTIDYPALRVPIDGASRERDQSMLVPEKAPKDHNSHKPGTFFSDIQVVSHIPQQDESRKSTQTMKPIFIEDSPSSVKHLELENKDSEHLHDSQNAIEENEKLKSVETVLTIDERDIQEPASIGDNNQVSSLQELVLSPANKAVPTGNVLHHQQEDASCSPPKRSLTKVLSPLPDVENIKPDSLSPLNDKVMENSQSSRNRKDDNTAPNSPKSVPDRISSPKSAFKTASPLKDVHNFDHDHSPTQYDEKHTSSSLLKTISSTDPSPLKNIQNIEHISPPFRDITPQVHNISSKKSDHPTSLSSTDQNDDEVDMDEVILVGAGNSNKWARPAPQRMSKMPAIPKVRHNKPAIPATTKSKQVDKAQNEPILRQNKADTMTTSKSQTKSLSIKKQKLPHTEKAGLPLDEVNDSHLVSLAGNKQIPKRETGISGNKPLVGGESAFMKRLLGAYQDEQRKSINEEIPLDKLERGLEEVLQDVNRNSLEVNKSLYILDENRDYLHTKRDIGRQRHYMSPTVSRLKRLQVQNTNQKLQSQLLAAQSTPHSRFNAADKHNAKTKLTGSIAESRISNGQAKSEQYSLQQPRKKRLGILNGMNAERLKIVQQRRKLQEKELVDGPKNEGKLTRSQESSQDLAKLTLSQSFAKATLSTQLKTHKPFDSSSKAVHNYHSNSKPPVSTVSKINENQIKQKPLDISHRNQQAHSRPKQANQDINSPHQMAAPKQDGITIPNTTTSDKTNQEEDSRPRKRPKLPLPDWAMSPELKKALEAQCSVNPEEIFGKMAPLRIEEIFGKGQS